MDKEVFWKVLSNPPLIRGCRNCGHGEWCESIGYSRCTISAGKTCSVYWKEGPDVKEDLWFWDGKHFLDEGRERYNDG